jgi:hypothetical protein
MNEAEIKDTPVEDGALFDMEDFKAEEAREEDFEAVEDTTEPTTEEVSTPVETKEEDYSKLLETLSGKIKYMDQEVKIENIDDLIKNVQKGLDYDRKTEKLNEIENSEELTYLKEKAKESGMTTKDYIKAIKDYEIQQAKTNEENEVREMIENGVAEHIARKVVETNRIAKELQQEKLRIAEEKRIVEDAKRKEAENEEFLNAYPSVDIKTIPVEVFKEAEKSNLLTAYTKYHNQQLLKEIELLKQNKKNEESSPIKGTTEHGGVVVEKQDDFLKGFLG